MEVIGVSSLKVCAKVPIARLGNVYTFTSSDYTTVHCAKRRRMNEPRVLSPENFRKAIMAEYGVTPESVSTEADTSVETVRRIIRRAESRTDTPKVKLVKAIIAHRTAQTVVGLWPEDEPRVPSSMSQATPDNGEG